MKESMFPQVRMCRSAGIDFPGPETGQKGYGTEEPRKILHSCLKNEKTYKIRQHSLKLQGVQNSVLPSEFHIPRLAAE